MSESKKSIKRVLFIKLTSMGDLIHALPALTDLQQHVPGVQVDWVIDESFYEVATWHPVVDQIFKSAHRRWRRGLRQAFGRGELRRFYRSIRARDYDIILDGQNNHKSAFVTWLARGKGNKHGLDKHSAREFAASWAYQQQHSVAKSEHAIRRQRQLFAKVFDYPLPETPADFSLNTQAFQKPDLIVPERYLFFVHNASWQSKLWPESYWQQLIGRVCSLGWSVLLPAGNAAEVARAERLAADQPRAIALPKLSLSEVAWLIANARGAVCVDTGLSHLTGALEIPAVTLYGATDSGLIGAPGVRQMHLQSHFSCVPCYQQTCRYKLASAVQPACYQELTPEQVWLSLQTLMGGTPS